MPSPPKLSSKITTALFCAFLKVCAHRDQAVSSHYDLFVDPGATSKDQVGDGNVSHAMVLLDGRKSEDVLIDGGGSLYESAF